MKGTFERSPSKEIQLRKKTKFILLTRHTDEELTHFLQKEAEKGWWLKKNNGNRFTFVEKPYEGKRICAYTFFSRGPESSTEVQLGRELPYLRKKGWDQIGVSKAENIVDSRRHAFLYEEKPTSFFPVTEDDEIKKAEKRSKRKAISNLILNALYFIAAVLLLFFDKVRLLTSLSYLLSYFTFFILLLFSIILSIKAITWVIKCRKNRKEETEKGNYRSLDHSTLSTSLMLFFLLIVLVISSIWGNGGSKGERVNINGTSIVLYSDEAPVSLETIGIEAKGAYRTTKTDNRKSPFAEYLHVYDQSFGGEETRLEYLSYSLFSSPYSFMLDMAESEMFGEAAIGDSALASRISVESVERSTSSGKILIKGNNSILTFDSSKELGEEDLKLLSSLIK